MIGGRGGEVKEIKRTAERNRYLNVRIGMGYEASEEK
jgi:hypothetical protein